MNNLLRNILIILLSLSISDAKASHIVGGEFTYVFLGDTLIADHSFHKYMVNLSIYEDCINGQPDAIAADDPAYLSVFNGTGKPEQIDTDIYSASRIVVPANFSNACVTNVPVTCLFKRTFVKVYYLEANTSGYIISYQRCCRNSQVQNISDPGNHGSTYFCTIPPFPYVNNSAVFKNYPPQIICLNEPLFYDHSATDIDGDSLSYEFCYALIGASSSDVKPVPVAPPYDSVSYLSPFSYLSPLPGFPPIHIDPVTGLITGTPNRTGRYLVTVCCNEWRKGVLVNTTKREFQFVVTNCSKTVVADIPQHSTDPNTYIVSCTDLKVDFENTSTGGFSWHWDFGVPVVTYDTSDEKVPSFTYPDTGTYAVKLVVNPASTCPDSITRFVKVYPVFHADFSDSGRHCPDQPVSFIDHSSASIKPVNYWLWDFGDGTNSSDQNPVHAYVHGGTYNVTLISQNIKNCVDTILKHIPIENFRPFAGNDTFIVRGESIHYESTGGIQYAWSPADNLNDTDIRDPIGFYPDTGVFTYYLNVKSAFGCTGYDTIQVNVINQAEFFVPSGFSPNGDGINDLFRPVAVGYRGLNYFRVFNRWGQQVFYSQSLESGWDGKFNHANAEMGVYFWEISFIDRFGKNSFLKGDVTLVR
jgi:gliding motility-associated-like protein